MIDDGEAVVECEDCDEAWEFPTLAEAWEFAARYTSCHGTGLFVNGTSYWPEPHGRAEA